jgi:hypothetical protein
MKLALSETKCRYFGDLFRLRGATDWRVLPVLSEKIASVRRQGRVWNEVRLTGVQAMIRRDYST